MESLAVLYGTGIFVVFATGVMFAVMHADWEDSFFKHDRKFYLIGWRLMLFCWAWPILAALGLKHLHIKAQRAIEEATKESHGND